MLSAAQLASIKQKAMQEVEKELVQHFKERILNQALNGEISEPSQSAKIEIEPVSTEVALSVEAPSESPKDAATEVSVMPEKRTAVIFGTTIRVTKDGTQVEAFVDGKWKNRTINFSDSELTAPSFFVPNLNKNAKAHVSSVILPRAVLQAFVGMPTYIEDVVLKHGERFLTGMKLVVYHDGNRKNNHVSNLDWVSEKCFVRAAKLKLIRNLSK